MSAPADARVRAMGAHNSKDRKLSAGAVAAVGANGEYISANNNRMRLGSFKRGNVCKCKQIYGV